MSEDFTTGQLHAYLGAIQLPAMAVSSSANNVFRCSKAVKITGADAQIMRRTAAELDAAAECLRRAADRAYEAPKLLQAAE